MLATVRSATGLNQYQTRTVESKKGLGHERFSTTAKTTKSLKKLTGAITTAAAGAGGAGVRTVSSITNDSQRTSNVLGRKGS